MEDPFFAEDDGEFDDFYGNGATGAKRAAQTTRPSEPRAQPPVRSAPSLPYPDTPASSVASFQSRSTDGGLLSVSTATPRHGDAAKKRHKMRRRRSQEQFDVEWEKDDDVAACFVCASAFSLLKRKHHCRHCGRVICSDCSSFRRFPSSRGKHRVCSYCNVEIANGGGRQTFGGATTMSDAEASTPLHHDPDQHGGSTQRQTIVGVVSSKSAGSRSRTTSENAPPVSGARGSTSRQTANKERIGDLFDTSDDMWFGDPVEDETSHKRRKWKPDQHQPKSATSSKYKDSYARPPVINAPDSLFDVQFTNGNQYDDESEDDERDEFSMPRPTIESGTTRGMRRTNDLHTSSHRSTAERLDAPLTMDDLQSSSASASYVSSAGAYDTALVVMPTIKTKGADQTFYGHDADHLVVDDAPGYYDSVVHEQANAPNITPGYSNPALMPRPSLVAPVSDDSSGTLVEASDLANVPTQVIPSKSEDRPSREKGFTGALKRFFGMSKVKGEAPAKQKPDTNSLPAESGETLPPTELQPHQPHVESSPIVRQIVAEMPRPTLLAPATSNHYDDENRYQTEETTDIYDARHTIATEEKSTHPPLQSVSETPLRHTVAGYVVPSSRADSLMRASVVGAVDTVREPVHQQVTRKKSRNPVRSRRDTFDALFDAPPGSLNSSARTPTKLPAQPWQPTYGERSAVGVDRFDRPRIEDADDDLTHGLKLPTDHIRSAPSQPASQSRTSWSGVSNHRLATETPMYATPNAYAGYEPAYEEYYDTQLPLPTASASECDPRDVFESGRGIDSRRTIMDDLKPKPTPPSSQTAMRKDSVDDYFAEFERPTEYVFDSASGTYVPANPRRSIQVSTDRTKGVDMQSSGAIETMELREERLRSSARTTDLLEPVHEGGSDEIDGIIADKISTLAGELEALKQLLRQRRMRSSPKSERKASMASRKQSIFDSDGDGNGDAVKPRSKTSGMSKRRPSSKRDKASADQVTQNNRRPRKDSFADLFEDGHDETANERGFGSRNYEALFQIGQTANTVENSDDESADTRLSTRARARGSKAMAERKNDSSSESEVKIRRSQRSKRSESSRFSHTVGNKDLPASMDSEKDSTPAPVASEVNPLAHKLSKNAVKRDVIDSLFDSDSDQDMGQLYGSTVTAPVSTLGRSSENDETVISGSEDESKAAIAPPTALMNEKARGNFVQLAVPTITDDGSGVAGASSDEEFSSTLKNLRGRRKIASLPTEAPISLPSLALFDADDGSSIPSSSAVRQVDTSLQLSVPVETAFSDEESVQHSKSVSFGSERQMVGFDGTLSDASEGMYNDGLTELKVTQSIDLLKTSSEGVFVESVEDLAEKHGDELLSYGNPSDSAVFDPLTLLDDEISVTGPAPSRVSVNVPVAADGPPESSPWKQDVSAIGEKLKPFRFRDELFDEPSIDAFGTSKSLNLDDLFNDEQAHSSGSEKDQEHSPSQGVENFTFEVKQRKRPSNPPVTSSPTAPAISSIRKVDVLASEVTSRETTRNVYELSEKPEIEDDDYRKEDLLSSVTEEPVSTSMANSSPSGEADIATEVDTAQFQDDWQRMQQQEKERKKKLQLKQRQAQREKLKKQSSSVRSFGKSGSTRAFTASGMSPTASGSSKSSKTEKEDGETSDRKKKKKHRKKAESENGLDNDEDDLALKKAEKRRQKRLVAPPPESADEKSERVLDESDDPPRGSGRTEL